MKSYLSLLIIILFMAHHRLVAQDNTTVPAIRESQFTVVNREVAYADGTAGLNGQPGAGILWLNGSNFRNGTLALDIKGKNAPGRSFVGLAFHGQDNDTYDVVYFRPFNFTNRERESHAVQYISLPENDWPTLRENFPGKYENTIRPVPDPVDDWFHVRIVIEHPNVKVYVNGFVQPTLEVDQLSDSKQGKVGFWVGNNSEGWFKNLKITNGK